MERFNFYEKTSEFEYGIPLCYSTAVLLHLCGIKISARNQILLNAVCKIVSLQIIKVLLIKMYFC